MCGIAGFCDFNKVLSKNVLINMTDKLHHRGPGSGYNFFQYESYNIGLGHRRLSILDLSIHGHQPMTYEYLEIIYNGEIYNFKEIRSELEKFNYIFESNCDTEVIIKAYHKWGIEAVDKFIGMFVIGIYDKHLKKIILIRDRTGVKPCFYYLSENLFMFSSELKSFHENKQFKKQINKNSLSLFMKYGYIPEPYCIFENTYKLKSGHYLEFDITTQKISEIKYWDVFDYYNQPKLDISDYEAELELEKIFRSAFEYRMVSDVPVGIFLSGGYDSSILTAILQSNSEQKINTFTIGFNEKKYDEIPYSINTSKYLGTNHTYHYCTQKDALDLLDKLPEIYDEPFADNSAIPTIICSQIAKKSVGVCLSADGGDEIFSGYNKYNSIIQKIKYFEKIPSFLKPLFSHFLRNKYLHKILENYRDIYDARSRFYKFADFINYDEKKILKESVIFSQPELNEIINFSFNNLITNFDLDIKQDKISNMLALDYKTFLVDDVLQKVDRATMSIGLEGREPLLDHRIIEFVAKLPNKMKIRNGENKWLLKKLTHKFIPKEMMNRVKSGFGLPIQKWLKQDFREYLEYYLNEKKLRKHDLFNSKEISALKEKYLNGLNINANKLWYILMFQIWYEKWID